MNNDSGEQQHAEELKREEDRTNAYADAMIRRDKDIITRYDDRRDLSPDGRNIAYWNSSIIEPQTRASAELSERLKGKRG